MQPWKMFIRSVSIGTLLTAGAFTAVQTVPFTNASRGTSPAVEEEASPDTDAPVVDPAAEVDETDTTTTTEAPTPDDPADTPSVDPADDPAPIEAPADDAADDTTTTAEPTPIKVTVAPPAADPAPAKAKAPKAKKDRTWDHNCDGRADNGWRKKSQAWLDAKDRHPCVITPSGPVPAPAAAPAPSAAPAPAPVAEGKGRSESAPGHTKSNDRPASAPGQMKKSV